MTDSNRTPDRIDVFAGQRLRARRLEQGLSQEYLATQVGVSFQQIQKYENGNNRISASRLYQFAEVLKVEPAFFFPAGEIEVASADPVVRRAKQIWDAARRRVSGRPMWDALNPNDPWDKALIDLAMTTARAELGFAEAA